MILKLKTENQSPINKVVSDEQTKSPSKDVTSNATWESQVAKNQDDSSIRVIESVDSTKHRTTSKHGSVGRTETDLKIDIELPIKVEKSLMKIMKFLTQYEIEEIQSYDMIYFIDLEPEYIRRKLK